MDFSIDRNQYEPPPSETIDGLAELSIGVMEQAEKDNVLFDMITRWSPERAAAYEQAFIMSTIVEQIRNTYMFKPEEDIDPNRFNI